MSKPLNLILKEEVEKLKGKVLYENDEGSSTEINLNDNITNYNSIEISIKTTDTEKIIKIDNPTINKTFFEKLCYTLGNNFIQVFSKFIIYENKISPVTENCGYYAISLFSGSLDMYFDKTNYIKITKIIGYK